jgi:hypothetical protein
MWDIITSSVGTGGLYRFSWRWTEHKENKQELFDKGKLIEELLKGMSAKQWVFQKELGEKTHKLHWQGYLKLDKKMRPNSLAVTLNNCGMHGVQLRAASNERALIAYCSKEDTRAEGEIVYSYPSTLYQRGLSGD